MDHLLIFILPFWTNLLTFSLHFLSGLWHYQSSIYTDAKNMYSLYINAKIDVFILKLINTHFI